MQHDDDVYLRHMLDMARKVVAKATNRRRADLDSDEEFCVVLTHWIQVIGEAASRVSAPTRARYHQIPWPLIVGLRHRIVHDYMNIDVDTLWEAATRSIPELIRDIEAILPPDAV